MQNGKRTTSTEDRRFASEWVVVAQLLSRPEMLPAIHLSTEDFGHPRCRRIYEVIAELYEEDGAKGVDAVTVADKLKEDPLILVEVVEHWAMHRFEVQSHAAIVRRRAADRALRNAAADLVTAGEEGVDLYELARKKILDVERVEAGRSYPVKELTQELHEELELAKGGQSPTDFLRWGSPALDRLFLLPRGGVFTIGARPGEGKSLLMGWLRLKLLALGESILSVSTEMLGKEDHRRTVAQDVAVDVNDFLLDYNLTPNQHERYLTKLRQLEAKPLWYLDRTGRKSDICREIDRRRRLSGVTCVLVDHINEMYDPPNAKHGRRQELDACWLGLRRACQEGHDVPPATLFVASELTRPTKDKAHRKPSMNDLKGTGKGEEISSVVVVIHDPWKHDPKLPDDVLHLLVDKHRWGPRGELQFRYDRSRGHILGLSTKRDGAPLPTRDQPKQAEVPTTRHWSDND